MNHPLNPMTDPSGYPMNHPINLTDNPIGLKSAYLTDGSSDIRIDQIRIAPLLLQTFFFYKLLNKTSPFRKLLQTFFFLQTLLNSKDFSTHFIRNFLGFPQPSIGNPVIIARPVFPLILSKLAR